MRIYVLLFLLFLLLLTSQKSLLLLQCCRCRPYPVAVQQSAVSVSNVSGVPFVARLFAVVYRALACVAFGHAALSVVVDG